MGFLLWNITYCAQVTYGSRYEDHRFRSRCCCSNRGKEAEDTQNQAVVIIRRWFPTSGLQLTHHETESILVTAERLWRPSAYGSDGVLSPYSRYCDTKMFRSTPGYYSANISKQCTRKQERSQTPSQGSYQKSVILARVTGN